MMGRILLAATVALALASCDALCFKGEARRICPGDPCDVGQSDEYCVDESEKLYCDGDGVYDNVTCDFCSPLYDADRRRYVAVCKR